MKALDSEFVLSTGRKFDANRGLVSAARTKDGFEIGEGYDGHVDGVFGEAYEPEDNWTPAERRELADYMIELWQEVRDAGGRDE